jgi:hypothetical protein
LNSSKGKNLEEAFFDDLINFATRKTSIGEKYDSAKSIEDLIYYVSGQFLEATIPIMFSLKGPKRGVLILNIMKHIKPASYLAYWSRNNKIFSACLIYVVNQFRNHIEETYQILLDEAFIEKIEVQTGIIYSSYVEMDKNEESMLEKT